MAKDYKLLKTQKNRVFEILQQEGLEPANFSWAEYPVMDTRLKYLDGKYYFQFEKWTDTYHCEFSPGQHDLVEEAETGIWDAQLNSLRFWTLHLKREIEASDLWQEMKKYQPPVSLALPEQPLNEPIPAYEAEQIADKLQQLAGKIEQQFELNEEQNKFVRNKLNYLTEAAKRQRSMDWVHTSIGVFVTIAMALELLPDKVKEFWQLVQSLFGEFIHLLGS